MEGGEIMDNKLSRDGIKTEYTFKPIMRIEDLSNFTIQAGNEFFDIHIEAAYSDQECWNSIPTMKKVIVWGYDKGIAYPVLEKQYEKLADVSEIANDLPEFHPVQLAIWFLIDEHMARF